MKKPRAFLGETLMSHDLEMIIQYIPLFSSFLQVTVDGTEEDKDCSTVSSSQTITSETTSGTSVTTTTTHISKVSRAN